MSGFTPGPWGVGDGGQYEPCTNVYCDDSFGSLVATCGHRYTVNISPAQEQANARLIAAAPTQHKEMVRYLPILERAEADPELWARLTAGTGIATANGYRAAIAKATGEPA